MMKITIFKLYAVVTYDKKGGFSEIDKQEEHYFLINSEAWHYNGLLFFNKLVKNYRTYACYADQNWRVELYKCTILNNCEIFPQSRVLHMDKYLYEKYGDMSNFPIIPCFSENLSYDNQYYLANNDEEKTPYYAKDGFVKEFETEFEAWEYLWGNNLIN